MENTREDAVVKEEVKEEVMVITDDVKANNAVIERYLASLGIPQDAIDAFKGVNGKANESDEKAIERARLKAEKAAKREAKRLEYDSTHLYVTEKAVSKAGNSYTKRIPATGNYTDKAVLLGIDGNCYIAICDDLEGGCFVRPYTRCSEKSSSYHWKSARADLCERKNLDDADALTCGMSFQDLLDKVRNCKGFTQAKAKRQLQVADLVNQKAASVHRNHVDAAKRAMEKAARIAKEAQASTEAVA